MPCQPPRHAREAGATTRWRQRQSASVLSERRQQGSVLDGNQALLQCARGFPYKVEEAVYLRICMLVVPLRRRRGPTMSSRGRRPLVLAYVVLALAYFDGAVAQAPLQNSPAPSADDSERLACGQQWDRLGDFSCDRDNSQRQTICGCRPPLFDNSSAWIYLGVIEDKECYSHVTGMSCGDTNLLRKAILACSSNWQTSGSLTCDNSGMERQTICECSPPGADNPALWMKEGGGCYSHLTGRSCSNPGRGDARNLGSRPKRWYLANGL